MRRLTRGRGGMTLAFLLGLVIATAGTAAAAKLITGKQIKDGTISEKDLSKTVRAKLAAPGGSGPQGIPGVKGDAGAKGDSGTPGRSALTALQSGESVTGGYYLSMPAGGGGAWVASAIPFPAPPTGIVIREVQDGPKPHCPGDVASPRADPGYVCVYEKNTTASLSGNDLFQATYDADAGRTHGFALYTTSAGNTYGVWAYTAG